MEWLPWFLLVAVGWWHFSSMRLSHRKRLNLTSYIVFLLMDDEVRNDNAEKFANWIPESGATDAPQLSIAASNTIEAFAVNLAESGDSLLGAHSLLWNSEAARTLRQ